MDGRSRFDDLGYDIIKVIWSYLELGEILLFTPRYPVDRYLNERQFIQELDQPKPVAQGPANRYDGIGRNMVIMGLEEPGTSNSDRVAKLVLQQLQMLELSVKRI